jgi:hypothetical protein
LPAGQVSPATAVDPPSDGVGYFLVRVAAGLRTTSPAAPAPSRISTSASAPPEGPPSDGSEVDVAGSVAPGGVPWAGFSTPEVVVVVLEVVLVLVLDVVSVVVVVVVVDSLTQNTEWLTAGT